MSNQQVLLHLGTFEDEPYQARLAGLTTGEQVAWKSMLRTPDTIAEVEMKCKAAGVTGIVCSNEAFLGKLLAAQPDFIPPNNRRGITLDDYQGSFLETPREKLPVIIINPLGNLVTVRYATAAAKRFIKKLTRPASWFPMTKFTWSLAQEDTIAATFNRWESRAALISIDIETPKPQTEHKAINCVGYCAYFPDTATTECLVIPFTSTYWWMWVRKFNKLPQPKVFQNGLYDNLYFMRWGCPVFNWLYDTQHLFHSWYSEFPKRLDFITAYSLRRIRYWKDDGKTGNLQDYYRYNAQDCWATLNSWLALIGECDDYALANYLEEFPLVFPSITCELEGLAADVERLAVVRGQKEQEVTLKQAALERMIACPGFNPNSTPQKKQLFKVLGVSHLPDTAAASMLKAKAAHPLNNRILSEMTEIIAARKLISTYLGQEKLFHGRWHYKINPAGTDTARLASTESSYWCGLQIQNIPRGDSLKQCCISDPGWLLAEIDKSQAEARCVGYLAGEEKLIAVVEGPHDYHSVNVTAFFGIPYEQVYDDAKKKTINKEIRDLAKRTNHGANYNMGATVMLDTMGPKNVSKAKVLLKLPRSWTLKQVCSYLLERYEATYPKVKGEYYDAIIREIELTGKLTSAFGWVRTFFGKPSRTNKPALNAAVAHPSQNLSVAIVNREFYKVWRCQIYGSYFKYEANVGHIAIEEVPCDLRGKIRIKAQIHDSIFFQYREGQDDLPEIVHGLMDTRINITGADGVTRSMFIPSEVAAGKRRWSELK
jgi:DNA polymerase I-like protein with 3'-5' exonuclease and polymerase domains